MGHPMAVSFEPTTSCNLRCPECPSGLRSFRRPTGMLEFSLFKKTIDEIAGHVSYLTLYFQGEPYLHPDFFNMVNYANKKKIFTATSTNAHYLTPENARKTILSGLDKLIISIDGTDQESYKKYRIGGSLDKVIEGTKNVLQYRTKLGSNNPYVVFQFLLLKSNEHQIRRIKSLAYEIGVDKLRLKTAQIYDFNRKSGVIPDELKYSRYMLNPDGKYRIRNKLLNHCWRMWSSSVITWDGRIIPCCFDKDAIHQMGHLGRHNFNEIWNSSAYRDFRNAILHSRRDIDICKNCTEGTKVWA